MIYLIIALGAAVTLVALVLIGAQRLGSSSIQIRGSVVKLFTIEISLDRVDAADRHALDSPPEYTSQTPLRHVEDRPDAA